MHVIEDKGELKFYQGEKELTLREGFQRLDYLYSTESKEGKDIIDRLKRKYGKDLFY